MQSRNSGVLDASVDRLIEQVPALRVDAVVYMRTDPSTCMERVRSRGRFEEASIQLDYLEQLHERHERWLLQRSCGAVPPRVSKSSDELPVLVLDCNGDFAVSQERQSAMVAAIDQFRNSLCTHAEQVDYDTTGCA